MKKIFLIIGLFFMCGTMQNLRAQLKDEVGHTVTEWSAWSTSACHKGIAWRFRQSFYHGNSGRFTWEYEVKNLYGRQVAFSFGFSETDANPGTEKRRTLQPNEVYRNTALPNAGYINSSVFSVCFSNDGRCKDDCYSPCDNGVPNIPDCAVSNSSPPANQSSINSTNTQRTVSPTNVNRYSEPTQQQKQAAALNQVSNSLIDLAKALDKAKNEKREKQRTEAAALLARQNDEKRKKEQAEFDKTAPGLLRYIGIPNVHDKFINFFSSVGFTYLDRQRVDNQDIDLFEEFSVKYLKEEIAVVFPAGKEKFMTLVMQQLFQIKDHITFYAANNVIVSNGFTITKTKGHRTSWHGAGVEEDYAFILKTAEKFSSATRTESNIQKTETGAGNYASAVKMAKIEADKETHDGYNAATALLEPYAFTMNGEDLNNLGFYFFKVKRYSSALIYFRMSGDKGNDWGNYNTGICYQNGWGIDTSKLKAFEYFSKVSPSFEEIGETYHKLAHLCIAGGNNLNGNSDYLTAERYYTMGARSMNISCMVHLGELYDKNGKFKTDLALAKHWYKKACDLKDEDACAKLKALD